jgi:hypothetical protein
MMPPPVYLAVYSTGLAMTAIAGVEREVQRVPSSRVMRQGASVW